jgi:short-subunit dehydrogenase
MKNRLPVLILGAKSDIGKAIAYHYAAKGHGIQLAARDIDDLGAVQSDIHLRHNVEVSLHEFDALRPETHSDFLDGLPALPEIAVCAVGALGQQAKQEADLTAATLILRSNFEGPANILAAIANRLEERGHGTIVGISSVAGERGRASNYVYGSAKAGFTAFLSGLRNRLAKKGVHVVTVLPGFVATKMTEGMDLPAKLTASPQEVSLAVGRAVEKQKDVIFTRPIWRLIMTIIRNIPERIFKGMSI